MTITEKSWIKYINDLRKVNDAAASKMLEFLNLHRDADGLWNSKAVRQLIIDYAYGLSEKYGNAASELACEMYESIGAMSDVVIPAAVPAQPATYGEVAKTVNGILKASNNEELISSGLARLVKMAGVDTVINNALRDGAEWAWIPHGDTCAFCITLASRGWQRASKDAIKNGHAEHIHANCDCTYAVRFNSSTQVQGYDPEEYLELYNGKGIDAEIWDGAHTPDEKINAMRRQFYKDNKGKINAQKRDAYEKRKELESSAAEEMNV